jgi:hypothetical protein
LCVNFVSCFASIPQVFHYKLRMKQDLISFRIVWHQIHSSTPLRFCVSATFFFSMIGK